MGTKTSNPTDTSGTVTFYTSEYGSGSGYTATSSCQDLTSSGFEGTFSSVTLPPHTKVIIYSEPNYAGKYLTIANGSTQTMNVDFSLTIGAFPGDIHTGFSWDGINMNAQCYSFKIYESIDENCQCTLYEFPLKYNDLRNEPVILYKDHYGYEYLTYFYADDPDFGPEHNDISSSILVFDDESA